MFLNIYIQEAVSEKDVRQYLGLSQTTGKTSKPQNGVRPIEIFMCSVIKRMGFAEGFQWLSSQIDG